MKATYLNENIALFNRLLDRYSKAKEEFLHLTGGEMPPLYFAFDTRFLLSSSLNISFDKNNILSKDARTCYVRLLKLSDLWITYEALLKILNEQGYNAEPAAKATALKDKDASEVFELDDILTNCNNQLKFNCLNNERFTKKIQDYLNFLAQNSSTTQVAVLNKALFSLKSIKPFNIQEIIAIIYAIHYLFINQGETSLSKIQNLLLTRFLFEILYDFLSLASLKIGTKLIKNKTVNITK